MKKILLSALAPVLFSSMVYSADVQNFTDLNTALGNNTDINIVEDITLTDSLVGTTFYSNVQGNNHVIDGNKHSGFIITTNSSFNIVNTTLKNFVNGGGGAISFNGKADIIDGIFEGNTATGAGGAIYVTYNAKVTEVKGSFNSNTANEYGGAIYNTGKIEKLEASFENNSSSVSGGALENNRNITTINSNFKGNSSLDGGAIGNSGNIGTITGLFEENSSDYYGGGIFNSNTITTIESAFKNNNAGYGGAIYNGAYGSKTTINTINSEFINNSASNQGGAIYGATNSYFGYIGGTFDGNTSDSFGGAIYTNGTIDEINATFKNNTAGEFGGAIGLESKGVIGKIHGLFENNSSPLAGVIANNGGVINSLSGSFINNKADLYAGAIGNLLGTINIVADTTDTIFTGNSANGESNAISNNLGIINLNANTNSKIIFNDAITGDKDAVALADFDELTSLINADNNIININSTKEKIKSFFEKIVKAVNPDKTDEEISLLASEKMNSVVLPEYTSGTVEINNKVENQTVNMFDGTLKLGTNVQNGIEYSGTFEDVNFNYYGGNVTLQNGGINHANLGNITLHNEMDLSLDADLANKQMDTISADSFVSNDNFINISNINLISGSKKSVTLSPLDKNMDSAVRSELANSIIYSGGDVTYGDLYKYVVTYDPNNANLNFKIAGSENDLNTFAPGVMAKPIVQSGAQTVQMDSYTEAFKNMDMFMLMPENERIAYKYRNKYAALTDDIVYDPIMSTYQNNTAWFRPYTTFENVPLKNGPKVSNVSYGTYFGYDSALTELGKGWDGTFGVYAGYNGSHQAFNGNSVYQNGGTLGLIGVAYKGNFFTGWTINAGASAGSTTNLHGTDNFTSLMGGISTKNGYNFEFADGKVILQPSVLLSYAFVNTFDYTNAAGVRMKSDPLHTLQIEPSVKLIGNIGTWQPYANVSMVWNVLNDTKVTANDIQLPEVSVKPYVKYGVGLQKKWADKFTAFGQAYVTNGGRNGVGLQAGLRVALGDETTKPKAAWLTPKKKPTTIVIDGKVK